MFKSGVILLIIVLYEYYTDIMKFKQMENEWAKIILNDPSLVSGRATVWKYKRLIYDFFSVLSEG